MTCSCKLTRRRVNENDEDALSAFGSAVNQHNSQYSSSFVLEKIVAATKQTVNGVIYEGTVLLNGQAKSHMYHIQCWIKNDPLSINVMQFYEVTNDEEKSNE